MPTATMNLRVLLPYQVFAAQTDVLRIVADTKAGSYGLLPQRLDCVAQLTPGILMYQTEAGGEMFVAIDEGIMVKVDAEVLISVRRAVRGTDLHDLHDMVVQQFLDVDQHEREKRSTMARLESGFLNRFAALHHD